MESGAKPGCRQLKGQLHGVLEALGVPSEKARPYLVLALCKITFGEWTGRDGAPKHVAIAGGLALSPGADRPAQGSRSR